jgi:hypothetical protein
MQDVPNIHNSKKIRELCREFNLSDPYRIMYPNRLEYTYVPYGTIRKNRSRLDFFLMSTDIAQRLESCTIKQNTQSKLFDHKAIVIDFNKKKSQSSRPNISNSILRDPNLDFVVALAYYECYAHATVNENLRNAALQRIGLGFSKVRESGPDPSHIEYMHTNLLDYDTRVRLKAEVRVILDELEELNLPASPLTVDDNNFLELLMNNVRNEVISYQSFISKTVNLSFKNLTEKIEALKRDYVQNITEISELEAKLREVNEIKINSVLERNKNFDTIHGELVTPFFLKMAKGFQHESSMRDICDSNGNHFPTLKEQKDYIRNHFANSFKKTAG